ncbi:hypothetical protein IFM89_013495 [Coptis chinensis]|uniref:O-methyltransferase C-terminal domain-containing protein n=1 Tax=Coptis chinensis TaxID=261450 RepID=A0A835LHU6_9MAGN|nr:hypothetical protein IFM89_013495 [Coptis chinensis]
MSVHSKLVMKMILQIYKGFEGLKTVVDVGGGTGATINMIVEKHPLVKGINFDLPHVIKDAPTYLGVEHIEGDMFVGVPKGDSIFLKSVLHDWNDEHCLKVLKNCYNALPANGKMIILDSIIPVYPETNVSAKHVFGLDTTMMVHTSGGGQERTEKEFKDLSLGAGFADYKVICSTFGISVIEFYKKA